VLGLLKPRAKRLNEFIDQLAPFFADPEGYDDEGVRKHLSTPGMADHVQALRGTWATVERFAAPILERDLRALAERRGLKAGALIHATRLALTGRMVSPGLFEMLELVGRERALARMDRLVAHLAGAA
jgi:glutamyl-tRNA synthetase